MHQKVICVMHCSVFFFFFFDKSLIEIFGACYMLVCVICSEIGYDFVQKSQVLLMSVSTTFCVHGEINHRPSHLGLLLLVYNFPFHHSCNSLFQPITS